MGRRTNKDETNTGAVLYCRVSTDEQAQEGVSLEAQESKLRSYCSLRGLDVVAVIVDAGVSAGKPLASRAGGTELLGLLKSRKAKHVVALKLDRLFRNTADCLATIEQWDRAGIAMHLIDLGGAAVDTSSASGRFFLTVLAGLAELERKQIGERTALALSFKASKGEYVGGKPPFGFRVASDGVHLEVNPVEQEIIANVHGLRSEGLSIRAIVSELARAGVMSRGGKPLGISQVASILEAA